MQTGVRLSQILKSELKYLLYHEIQPSDRESQLPHYYDFIINCRFHFLLLLQLD